MARLGYFNTPRNMWRSATDPIIGGQDRLDSQTGSKAIRTNAVQAESLIFLSSADAPGRGLLYCDPATIVPGVGFTVKSTGGPGSTDVFNWFIANFN